MDQIGVRGTRGHRQVDRQRPERRQRRLLAGELVPGVVAHVAGVPRVHRNLLEPGKLAREVFDVHARTAVHGGRILASEERHPQSTTSPLGITTTPPADTLKRSA